MSCMRVVSMATWLEIISQILVLIVVCVILSAVDASSCTVVMSSVHYNSIVASHDIISNNVSVSFSSCVLECAYMSF